MSTSNSRPQAFALIFFIGAILFFFGEAQAQTCETPSSVNGCFAGIEELVGKPILSVERLPIEQRSLIEATIITKSPVYLYPARGVASVASAAGFRSLPPAVLLLDDDGDGLANSVEERLGTDLTKKDTDDDGFDDRQELQEGFDPIGDGQRRIVTAGIDEAFIFERTVSQPLLSGTTTSDLAIVEAGNVDGRVELSGWGPDNSIVTLFIYSGVPVVVTAVTNDQGFWTYHFPAALAYDDHEAYAALVDEEGAIVARSEPYIFRIEAPIVHTAAAAIPIEQVAESYSGWRIYAYVILMVVLGFVIAVMYWTGVRMMHDYRRSIHLHPYQRNRRQSGNRP